ncbi:MAG: GrpB family protein [Chitinophagaceae bacterium]
MKFLEPYNPAWKAAFEKLAIIFRTELAFLDPPVDIQHVGSTSINGMLAKPILDIDIVIAEPTQLDPITQTLEKIGYESKGEQGIPGRFAFRQTSAKTPLTRAKTTWQDHHLYVCFADSLALRNHLAFRDMLRNSPDLAAQYAQLKRSITSDPKVSMEQYWKSKTAFIISVLAAAGFSAEELSDINNANQ